MKKNKFTNKNLIDLLIKKAQGFYYTEEIYEYEKTQNKSNLKQKISQNEDNLNFFDICDRVLTNTNNSCDTIKSSNENQQVPDKNNENLTLVKKKVSTHFVSPDMLAIKILFEIYGKEMNENNLNKLSDSELLNLKNKLTEELINEYNQNQSKN